MLANVSTRTLPDAAPVEAPPMFTNSAFLPNVYVDISGEYAEKKYEAMKCYATELREYPHPRSIEALKIMDQANGIHVGLSSAECFMLHRSIR